jgi:hypothetical protein
MLLRPFTIMPSNSTRRPTGEGGNQTKKKLLPSFFALPLGAKWPVGLFHPSAARRRIPHRTSSF